MHVGGETRSPKQRFGITNLLDFTRQNGVGQASALLEGGALGGPSNENQTSNQR